MIPDTIAAIATATGPAGVGIVRVSGPNAFTVADRLTRPKHPTSQANGHSLRRITVFDPQTHEAIDDGLLAIFCSPRSFTGDDIVEFQVHGGTIVLTRVFAACLSEGARTARPGEFSERAFVNGKLDLAQAEAVAAIIEAGTVAAQRAARRQLSGALSQSVHSCRDAILEALARIEASIDFPEEVGDLDTVSVGHSLNRASHEIDSLLATATYGQRLRNGMVIALTGRPNVGKSSLLNALAGTDRAIVTDVPGTTRDVVEEPLNLAGIPVRVLDTAGLRRTDDIVERIGVERARRAVADADVVVLVLDAGAGLLPDDEEFLSTLLDRPHVVAVNKADTSGPDSLLALLRERGATAIPTVAPLGIGIPELAQAITVAATGGGITSEQTPLVTSARQEAALREALAALARATESLTLGLASELIAVDAHGALHSLGEITGETTREDVIRDIFSRFCIGK